MGLFNDAFLPFIAKTRPVLLILDNHVSHWSAYAIDAGRDNGVDLQFFPSHSFLHLLQPLDVGSTKMLARSAVNRLSFL
jgi:hypothetical protein